MRLVIFFGMRFYNPPELFGQVCNLKIQVFFNPDSFRLGVKHDKSR
jgi:hypothetical protein